MICRLGMERVTRTRVAEGRPGFDRSKLPARAASLVLSLLLPLLMTPDHGRARAAGLSTASRRWCRSEDPYVETRH